MKILNKKIIKIAAIVFGVLFIIYLIMMVPEFWKSYKAQKALEKFEAEMRKPYEEDIYGGKTPEETWQMFLDALKKGDIDLASRYFDVEHQGEAKKWLENLKQENRLNQNIEEMETLHKSEEKTISQDRAYYFYYYYDEEFKQNFSSPTSFYLNPYTKVWKILY
jgi:hypothetical protein